MRARLPSSAVSPLPVASGPARVAESVDAADLKSAPFGGVSSNLTPGTEGADPWGIPGRRSKLPVLANEAKGSSVARRLHGAATVDGDQRSEPVGKRLSFLAQEMHREANTLGSKANDAELSQASIAIKEELERIREQVENVE